MSTPINPKPRLNLRFLYGILFGFFTSYALFYFHITPFECAPCPTNTDTVTVVQCEVPKGQDEEPQFGKWLAEQDEQTIMAKFRDLPANERVNSTYGGRIGRANLQRLLNDMPADRKWVHFRYGMIDGTDASGTTAPRLVVLFRNDVFQDAVTHSTSSGRTIMNLGFCPLDCGND
ncbi:MAG: hypothetical protein ACK5U7_08685 [Bacteroidota bacterium]|jgi:hypothetical protein